MMPRTQRLLNLTSPSWDMKHVLGTASLARVQRQHAPCQSPRLPLQQPGPGIASQLPCCRWCPVCISTTKPNHHHRRNRNCTRFIPFLVADYCYIRNSSDDQLICLLVMKIYPFGLILAVVVDNKGVQNQDLITRVAQLLQYVGLTQAPYRSDQEPSLTALFAEACRLAGKRPLPITAEQEGEATDVCR